MDHRVAGLRPLFLNSIMMFAGVEG